MENSTSGGFIAVCFLPDYVCDSCVHFYTILLDATKQIVNSGIYNSCQYFLLFPICPYYFQFFEMHPKTSSFLGPSTHHQGNQASNVDHPIHRSSGFLRLLGFRIIDHAKKIYLNTGEVFRMLLMFFLPMFTGIIVFSCKLSHIA